MARHFKPGNTPWNKGLKRLMVGERNPSWKGGLPNCLSCDKQLSRRDAKRCRACLAPYFSELYRGARSHRRKGGKTNENKIIRESSAYEAWRKEVLARDNWRCQFCGERGGKLHPHHIRPFALFPALRFEVLNGITLCESCHKTTPTFGNHKVEVPDFQKVTINK
jgi:hypothetical protein